MQNGLIYNKPSEDEGCLLEMTLATKKMGYFASRDSKTISILDESGHLRQFEILKWNEFDPVR